MSVIRERMAAPGNTPMDRGDSLAAENSRRGVVGASPKDAGCVGGNGAWQWMQKWLCVVIIPVNFP